MINVEKFTAFLKDTFKESIIYFDRFKPELFFFEMDCLNPSDKKLSVEVSSEAVKISAINKEPSIDFSLHDYSFDDEEAARSYLIEVYKTGICT